MNDTDASLKNIDYKRCPICKKINYCQISRKKECWCFNTKIPQQLIDTIDDQAKGSCICLDCVKRFKKNE